MVAKTKSEKPPDTPGGKETGAGVSKKAVGTGGLFPIVGIGASAGGLEALEALFKAMPLETGMAFVVIQHLSPTHKSIMGSILAKHTALPISEIDDGMAVAPNHVYLAPAGKNVTLINKTFQLLDPLEARGMALPIDFFFRSLSHEMSEKAICIILSGTASDGTLGLKEVKGRGGMAMVQSLASARYDGMPRSAMETGLVDYILSPEEMPKQLLGYVKHPYVEARAAVAVSEKQSVNHVQKAFAIIRTHTGHDFSNYKKTTILRRMERRMAVNQIEKMADYLRFLQEVPAERTALFRDLLIGVTSFFRDAEPFAALQEKAFPGLFEGRDPGRPIRVWVAGCSTGEEAYSMGMLLQETMERLRCVFDIQIFASDIDVRAIDAARAGMYPAAISADVSKERLKRFFTKEDDTYRISKSIRDMIVFSSHNVIKDPPFSKIDLLSCRNLLIYMEGILQKKLLPLFHYALNKNGILFLGTSESIGEFRDLFKTIDGKGKIFKKIENSFERTTEYTVFGGVPFPLPGGAIPQKETSDPQDLQQAAERVILDSYAPPGVLINRNHEIVHFMGRTERYLTPPTGKATFHILKMIRETLRSHLASALHNAFRQKEEVRVAGLSLEVDREIRKVNLIVRPFEGKGVAEPMMLVIFEEENFPKPLEETKKTPPAIDATGQTVAGLQQELASTREYLQTLMEEQETSNEELKSTNEELQSVNEELQSTNEELETSKEELQSTNEELMTVNMELQKKLEELTRTNDDLSNLLASTDIATIFLDPGLSIKRFTPQAAKIFRLISTDVGRPLADIVSRLEDYPLIREARKVLDTLTVHESQVTSREGSTYELRILPYRTVDNVIDGVVITLVDVSSRREAELTVEQARRYAEEIVDALREPLLVLDAELRVISANRSFYSRFETKREDSEGRYLYALCSGGWDNPELRRLLEEVLPKARGFEDFEITVILPGVGKKKLVLNARRIQTRFGEGERILLAMEEG